MANHLVDILKQLTKATRMVAHSNGIKRIPAPLDVAALDEKRLMTAIGDHIRFLEAPHLAYLLPRIENSGARATGGANSGAGTRPHRSRCRLSRRQTPESS